MRQEGDIAKYDPGYDTHFVRYTDLPDVDEKVYYGNEQYIHITREGQGEMSFIAIYRATDGVVVAADSRRTERDKTTGKETPHDDQQKIYRFGDNSVVVATGVTGFGLKNNITLFDVILSSHPNLLTSREQAVIENVRQIGVFGLTSNEGARISFVAYDARSARVMVRTYDIVEHNVIEAMEYVMENDGIFTQGVNYDEKIIRTLKPKETDCENAIPKMKAMIRALIALGVDATDDKRFVGGVPDVYSITEDGVRHENPENFLH